MKGYLSIPRHDLKRIASLLQTPRPRLVIDWHNYGHTILSLALGGRHPLVRLSKAVEALFAPAADAAFCVSKAMKDDLERDEGWVELAARGASVTVLYDRPAEHFRFGVEFVISF